MSIFHFEIVMTEDDTAATSTALDKLLKKQKAFHRTCTVSIDKAIATLNAALACQDEAARRKILADANLQNGPLADIHSATKEYYGTLGKLSKAIDKVNTNLGTLAKPCA